MIQYEFKERTQNKLIPKKVSLIIATSPIPSHPNTDIVDKALDSILKMNYPFHEIIISYDKPMTKNKNYEKYKIKMKQKYPKFNHLPMKKHGHFIGSFHNALNHLETEYFMMLQHDIQLIGNFPIDKCLSYKFDWNIIATHHMKNSLKETHWFPIIQNKNKELQKVWGWSERIFLSRRNWMMDKIHEYYHKGMTKNFIESIFHHEFDKLYMKTQGIKYYHEISTNPKFMKIYNKFWKEWKCYLLKSDISYHVHLCGRTKTKNKKKTKRNKRRNTRKKSRGGCGQRK